MTCYPSVEQVENFHIFVDQTLDIRGDMPIENLLLKCEKECDYDCFYDMLCTLVRFKAGGGELELRFTMFWKIGIRQATFVGICQRLGIHLLG